MINVSMIFLTKIGFRFENSQNIISTSREALFSQNTLSNSNFFFLSPPSPSFLGVDFGVCNYSKLVPIFPDGEVLFETSICFNSPIFKS
jgi:hypothetical protein